MALEESRKSNEPSLRDLTDITRLPLEGQSFVETLEASGVYFEVQLDMLKRFLKDNAPKLGLNYAKLGNLFNESADAFTFAASRLSPNELKKYQQLLAEYNNSARMQAEPTLPPVFSPDPRPFKVPVTDEADGYSPDGRDDSHQKADYPSRRKGTHREGTYLINEDKQNRVVEALRRFKDEHPGEKVNLSELARRLGMSMGTARNYYLFAKAADPTLPDSLTRQDSKRSSAAHLGSVSRRPTDFPPSEDKPLDKLASDISLPTATDVFVQEPVRKDAEEKTDEIVEIQAHETPIYTLAVSSSGKLVTVGDRNRLRVWEIEQGQPLRDITVAGISRGRFITLANNTVVVEQFKDNLRSIAVWDLEEGKMRLRIPIQTRTVYSLAALSENRIAVGFSREVGIWDLKTGASLQVIKQHTPTTGIAQLPDGLIATVVRNSFIRIWNPEREEIVGEIDNRHWIEELVVGPSGELIVSDHGQSLNLWDPKTGRLMSRLSGFSYNPYSIGHVDSDTIVFASQDIFFYNLKSMVRKRVSPQHRSRFLCVTALPDGRLAAGDRGGKVTVWYPK